jgi:GGDEF domain-containing protein
VLSRSSCDDALETKRTNRKERYPSDESDIVYQGGASIGIVLFFGDEISQLELFAQADKAMYQAKKSGGNSVSFYKDSQNSPS